MRRTRQEAHPVFIRLPWNRISNAGYLHWTYPPLFHRTAAFLTIMKLSPINLCGNWYVIPCVHSRITLAKDDVPDISPYLQLPAESGIQARQLAQQLRQNVPDNTAFVQTVLKYIAEQPFYYTRQPPLLFDDPVDEFLFDSRRGFCEHYASAFVFLMRAAGVPARVVTGYQGGEMNPQSDYFIVRQSDAHAWTEVWLRGEGWRRIDPTSGHSR